MSATITLPPRLAFLFDLIVREGGEWSPSRVEPNYANSGHRAPKHTTHSADLERLWRMGLLDQHETRKGRHYTPRGTA